jgi:HPt (histidine-containing phosphotransfer) domain-containing protein
MKGLVPGYLAARRKELPELFSFYVTEDRESLAGAAHKLAATGHSYGLDRLSELGTQIETLSKAGDAAGVSARLSELKDYIENLEVLYE